MGAFFSYVLLGLSLAAPIGPINAAQLDKGIKKGFWHAWILGWGAILADVVFIALVFFGVVHFLDNSFMKTFLWLFGFFVLTYTGIESLLSAGKIEVNVRKAKDSLFSSFLSGFIMSLSNPLSILFWLGIYGSILANSASKYDMNHLLLYSSGILIGLLAWDFTMAIIASTFRRFLSKSILMGISIISGISLIGIGIYFAIQAAKVLFT
ncbi:threonine/homoserine/homoserine lactone efflux protein [Peribacillus simplex]|uniref:LysE family transporter n=1 Tax=Peribacillus simplex TaxID=1478 RepID=UPI0024E1DD35|nr:LysE family transporter [Peribacillus simplex]MDF9759883.1 threonine/homoserine/homoserine lactone efflux protein [Peribacillus simplex]